MRAIIALASWLYGLSTSLGNGYESIASILNGGYKRQFTGSFTPQITEQQAASIAAIINNLKTNGNPNLDHENSLLLSPAAIMRGRVLSLGFTADTYIETNAYIEAIELKSVRPNSGEGRGEKQKILSGKAAFKLMHPDKDVRFYVGFPFDPTANTPTGYDKDRFFNYLVEFRKFFAHEEILIGSELWDHLSGEPNTMEIILEIIEETVSDFVDNN
ncbi:MAG: TdeIII family type II restriction endonuclease [Gallionella sp.]|nr:TdeIII family type II restriction endonuclease [Gallionella sp.]